MKLVVQAQKGILQMVIVFVKQNAINVSGLLCPYFSQSLYTYKPTANIHSHCFTPKSNPSS